jgi:hypothetical protein
VITRFKSLQAQSLNWLWVHLYQPHKHSSSSSMQLLNLGGKGRKENTNKLNKLGTHALMNCLQVVVLFSGLLYFFVHVEED